MALLANNESRKNSFTKTNDMRGKKGRKSTMKIRMNKSGMAAESDNNPNDTGILSVVDREAKSPVSPDPSRLVRTKSSAEVKLKKLEDVSLTNKIFDFTN